MEELDHKEILALLETLPIQIQEVIKNSNWTEKLSAISKRHNLRLDQMSQLENLVFLIMLGVINPNKIGTELAEIGVKSDQIDSLIAEIEQEIFQKIKTELINNFERLEDSPEVSETKNPLERDAILKEIEDHDESNLPATQINIPVPTPTIIQSNPTNSVAQKLQTPTVSAPTTMKIDPYRELPE